MTWGLIFEWILNDSRMTLEWLYDDFRMTSGWLWNNFRMTLEWFWMTFSRLFYFERTYCPISNIVSFQISHDLIQNPLVDLYLNFEKIKLENSILTNWIFSLQKSISKLIFADYTGSKNQVRNRKKIHFAELDFSEIKVRSTGGCKGYDNTIKTR